MGKVLIVGAGVAGLTAGICLCEAGREVTILERQGTAGGNLTAWERDGYLIDNCLHWLTGTREGNSLNRLWRRVGALGDGIELVRTDPFYTSCMGKESISFWRDTDRTERCMLEISPEDGDEICRFTDAIRAFGDGGTVAKLRAILRYGRMTVGELAERFRHPLLSRAVSDYIGAEYAALGLLLALGAHSAGNADLPRGGSRGMAERMLQRYLSLGGRLVTSCRVEKAVTDGGRVSALLVSNGMAYDADDYIFACDPHITFGELLPSVHAPRGWQKQAELQTVSSIHAAFSVRMADLPIRGTVIFDGTLGEHARRARGRIMVRVFDHEPSFAREGHAVLQVMLFVGEEEAGEWLALRRDSERYRAKKRELAARLYRALTEAYPSLYGTLSLLDVWTPATYRRYTGAYLGDYIGYVMPPGMLPLHIPPRIAGLENAYLSSGWQRMPSGLPSAARAGETAAKAVIARTRGTRGVKKIPSAEKNVSGIDRGEIM